MTSLDNPATSQKFRRIVLTGTECSGKSTLATRLADHLAWPLVDEAARQHPDVLQQTVSLDTFDDLHDIQTRACVEACNAGSAGVVCDTGDVVLGIWSSVVLGQPWHPLSAPWPAVDLYLLCPPLTQWEPDPLRTMPSLEDRMALHRTYESALRHRPHLVVQGNTPEERLEHLLNEWPW